MASFTEPFDSLAAWDFGTSPTTDFTLASSSPAPYLGSSRATMSENATVWAAARFDLDDPNVPGTTYWVSYAIYIDSWADIFNDDWSGAYLPGFINFNDDPIKGFSGTDDVQWSLPYLQADNSSSGKIYSWFGGVGDGEPITAGTWHTVRYGLRLNGASSYEEIWLDDTQFFSQSFNAGAGTKDTNGLAGALVAHWGDTGASPVLIFLDSMLYEAGADPGEPHEGSGGPVADSDPTDIVADAPPDDNPAGPAGSDCDIQVLLDDVDVSAVSIEGSVTRRLNRPSQATIKIPMDSAIGGPGSRLKIYFDSTLFFHGMVMDCETDSGEDDGYTVYNASDPMELWNFRPVRAGDGDFSNPDINLLGEGPAITLSGPDMIQAVLMNTEGNSTAQGSASLSPPTDAEGPTFLTFGTFEPGGVQLTGAPQDWPQSIGDFVNLLTSTGEVDVVITPTDPGGGIMGTVDVYNGDYGTDLSGSVTLSYGMGDYSIRRVRWNEDMSNICNKLWYFAGPRIETAADPEGNQHWCFNVTGDDCCFTGVDGPHCTCTSPDAAAMQTAFAAVDSCRDESQDTYGVRMEIQIFDASGDNCTGQGGTIHERDLYRWNWLAESWARCNPRELIHVTPIRGYPVGNFDIGDLITVQATSAVRGGFSGAQRIYQYTVSWDADGPCEISELQTSSDVGL